jgi:hypothetical protein
MSLLFYTMVSMRCQASLRNADDSDVTENMAHDQVKPETVAFKTKNCETDTIQVTKSMNESINLFLEAGKTGHMSPRGSGISKIQAKMFQEMAAIDKPRAMVAMKAWAEFLQLTSSRDRRKQFETLEDYIPYRVWDVGQMYVLVHPYFPCNNPNGP